MRLHTLYTIYALTLVLTLVACSSQKASDPRQADAYPPIFPDYIDVTIPSTIAPLNFDLAVDGVKAVDVSFTAPDGSSFSCQGDQGIDIPIEKWRDMLSNTLGGDIHVQVYGKFADGWIAYKPFDMHVSADSIDYGLMYRLISPGYEVYAHMGIFQRDISTFDESAVFENTQIRACMNCHSANHCDPDNFQLHIRGEHGATLILKDGQLDAYNTKTDSTISACVYPYWHPSGKYIAYSNNTTHQMMHQALNKPVEVFDEASQVVVYDTEANKLIRSPLLSDTMRYATFPAFASEGDKLYFCLANAVDMPDSVLEVRYDLCRIDFDPEAGRFGDKIDTLICASADGKSITLPRPSFDGRYLLYTLIDYGQFSIWHDEADLWMLDLATGETWPLEAANSPDTESYHNWSSNSRWIVFGSRRNNGLYTQPFICHIDANGQAATPFLLPQRQPSKHYDERYKSYNIPEFITHPVPLDRHQAEGLLRNPQRTNFGL